MADVQLIRKATAAAVVQGASPTADVALIGGVDVGGARRIGTEVTLAGLAGAVVTAAGLIPAGCLLLGVRALVQVAITGPATFHIGTVADPTAFGANIAIALNTTTTLQNTNQGTPHFYVVATDVILTAVGGGGLFTGGTVKLRADYITMAVLT